MPVSIRKVDGFRVSTPRGVKARHATRANAEAQRNLLNAVEHGWRPTGQPKRKRKFKDLPVHVRRKALAGKGK